jgi:hypothetical protein
MIEVLKQALEAFDDRSSLLKWQAAREALRQAIAQLESQEPAAWRIKVETKLRDGSVDVGYQLRNEKFSVYDEPLYTHPPQRTWRGLTMDEIALLHANYPNPQGFALALQAIFKERNT